MKRTKWQESKAGFMDYISGINALQESFKSSLLPISHKTCAVILASKAMRILKLLEICEIESLRESEAFINLELYVDLFCSTFKPSFCYFEIYELDALDLRDVKKLANQLLTARMLKE